MLGKKFLLVCLHGDACLPRRPAIQRHERRHAVDQEKHERHRRDKRAPTQRNRASRAQDGRQQDAHPDQAERAPGQRMREVRAPLDVQKLVAVVPGQHAKRRLHVPADAELHRRAHDARYYVDEGGVFVPHAVQREGEQCCARAVYGRQRRKHQPRAALPHVVHEQAKHHLDAQTGKRADDENPKDVEEIERDVGLAVWVRVGFLVPREGVGEV